MSAGARLIGGSRCARALAAFGLVAVALGAPAPARALDPGELAECVADSGAVFYGAHWCPHCSRQRARFGGFAHLLNYVECSEPGQRKQTAECRKAGVRSYPTWDFPNGSRRTGMLSLDDLAAATGCQQ